MAEPSLILAVDDDPSILHLVRLELSEHGFRVLTAETGAQALKLSEQQVPDLVVLDVMLPDLPGIEVLRQLRQRGGVSVIMLTARSTHGDKVNALNSGADDYTAKPFSPKELAARVKAVLRRAQPVPVSEAPIVHVAGFVIDLRRRLVLRDDEIVLLTRTEWTVLQALAEHVGEVVPNEQTLSEVWRTAHRDDLQYLRIWISRLRKKLQDGPLEDSSVRTFHGFGYMLQGAAEGEAKPFDANPER